MQRACRGWSQITGPVLAGPRPTAQGPQVRSRVAGEDVSQVKAWPHRVQVMVTGCGISGSATGPTGPVRAGAVPGPALFPLDQREGEP
jgi:hypothetical protein